jgi:hypothetical protein
MQQDAEFFPGVGRGNFSATFRSRLCDDEGATLKMAVKNFSDL